MIKFKIGFTVLSSVFILSSFAYAGGGNKTANSCINCHLKLPSSSFIGMRSHMWKGSIHQKHGLTCNDCHGGNPNAKTKKEAHKGVLSSSNPKSKVYYKNIPSTCGKCHGVEFYKFTQSYHYKKLKTTGQGPDCVTCHGSMVTTVLNPNDLVNVCKRCHNARMGVFPYIPQKAKAVLLLLKDSKLLVNADKKLYKIRKGTPNAKAMQKAQLALNSAKLEWHTFDLDAIIMYLQNVSNRLQRLSSKPVKPVHRIPRKKQK